MNTRRKASNWWFVHRACKDEQLERLKIPHHDVKYLVFRVQKKDDGNYVHGVVELNHVATMKQMSQILGPFYFFPNSVSFGRTRIEEYKKHDDKFEIYPDTTKYMEKPNTFSTVMKTCVKSGLTVLSEITSKLASKLDA